VVRVVGVCVCVLLDVLLEQMLVGPSPNLHLLSYLRHAVSTQVIVIYTVSQKKIPTFFNLKIKRFCYFFVQIFLIQLAVK